MQLTHSLKPPGFNPWNVRRENPVSKFFFFKFQTCTAYSEAGHTLVGLFRLNPVDPQLESARFQHFNLKCDILVSSLCFQMQLVPLHAGRHLRAAAGGGALHVESS
jgi:hypothetical protein